MKFRYRTFGVLFLASLALVPSAAAQAEDQPVPRSDVSRRDGSLSQKLNATSGVIHPEEGIDPGMQKAPPATGAMPVVPPPGTPGGPRDVDPK